MNIINSIFRLYLCILMQTTAIPYSSMTTSEVTFLQLTSLSPNPSLLRANSSVNDDLMLTCLIFPLLLILKCNCLKILQCVIFLQGLQPF